MYESQRGARWGCEDAAASWPDERACRGVCCTHTLPREPDRTRHLDRGPRPTSLSEGSRRRDPRTWRGGLATNFRRPGLRRNLAGPRSHRPDRREPIRRARRPRPSRGVARPPPASSGNRANDSARDRRREPWPRRGRRAPSVQSQTLESRTGSRPIPATRSYEVEGEAGGDGRRPALLGDADDDVGGLDNRRDLRTVGEVELADSFDGDGRNKPHAPAANTTLAIASPWVMPVTTAECSRWTRSALRGDATRVSDCPQVESIHRGVRDASRVGPGGHGSFTHADRRRGVCAGSRLRW
jgi:hypothetical protein